MIDLKLFARQASLVALTLIITSLSGIILLPILTKNLSIGDYGLWLLIMAIVGLAPQILGLGLPFTMLRFLPSMNSISDKCQIFYSFLSITILVSGLISSISSIILIKLGRIFFDLDSVIVVLVALTIVIQTAYVTGSAYFQANQYVKKYSICTVSIPILQIVFYSIVVLNGLGVRGLLIANLSVYFLVLAFILTSVLKEIGFELPRFNNLRNYLSFGIPTVPGNLSSWITNSSDRYLIGLFLGNEWVGYYGPGYSLGSIVKNFTSPIMFLLTTSLSKDYDMGNHNDAKNTLTYVLKYFLALGIPAVFGLSLLSKPLLTVLTTQELAANGYLITPITALSFLLFGIYAIVMRLFIFEKKTAFLGKVWIYAAVINFVLNIIFIPFFGIIGAAFTTLCAFAFALFMGEYYSSGLLKFRQIQLFIVKSLIASSLMSLPIYMIKPTGIIQISITVLISIAVYFILLVLMRAFSKREIQFFKSLILRG